MNQQMGLDLSNAAQQNAQGQFQRQATVAGLTSPVHYLASQSQPFSGGDILGIGSSVGMGLL